MNLWNDERKIPKISINVKIKVKTDTPEEFAAWNSVFGYIMKKPRTKLEFITVNSLRKLPLHELTVEDLKRYLSEEDYTQLLKIEGIFNYKLTNDIKAFILAVLRLPIKNIEELLNVKSNAI